MKKAFTLAEVLITLGLISVIVSMTLPAIIQKKNEREAVAQLKKAYSAFSQAYLYAESEFGSPDNWGLVAYADRRGALKLLEILCKYMKTNKICDKKRDCFPNVIYKSLNSKVNANLEDINHYAAGAEAILYDGTLIKTFIWDNNCKRVLGKTKELQNVCATISIDINGHRKPNQYGMDFFVFNLTKYGIIPNGMPEQTTPNSFENSCKDKDRGSNGWSPNGDGCAAWVIFNENMDYLHCKDLSWSGKLKCK